VRRGPVCRVVEQVCLLVPGGTRRMVVAAPAWRRDTGPGPAADDLAALLARRGVPRPAALGGVRPSRAPDGSPSPAGPLRAGPMARDVRR